MSGKAFPVAERAHPLVSVGEISRPHGLKGEVRIHLFNAESVVLSGLPTLRIQLRDGSQVELGVVAMRRNRGVLVVKLDGVDTRTDAEALKGAGILVPRADLPPPEEGEFYDIDLIGLRARAPDGEVLGRVVAVEHPPANDTVTLHLVDDTFVDLPLIDAYVLEVDLRSGHLTVNIPEGLPRRGAR